MRANIVHSGLPRRTIAFDGELLFAKGIGGMVYDVEGRSYVDFVLGYGAVVLGHGIAEFIRLVGKYSKHGLLLPGYSRFHVQYISNLLGKETKDYSVAFFKTASESVTAALRLAADLTGKMGVVRCGFLGWHDVLLGNSIRWHETLESPIRGISRFVDGFRGISGDERAFNWSSLNIEELESILRENSASIGSFAIDTYQLQFSNSKTIEEAISLCRARDILVILDETKLAGRVAKLGLGAKFGWYSDITILGKALANGAPLSLLLGKPEILAASEKIRITGTFSQELSAIYSGMATAEIMDGTDGYSRLCRIGARVVDEFCAASKIADVSDKVSLVPVFGGSLIEIKFAAAILGDWECRQALCTMLASNGVLMLQGHASYVCLAHETLDFNDLRNRFAAALNEWKNGTLQGDSN